MTDDAADGGASVDSWRGDEGRVALTALATVGAVVSVGAAAALPGLRAYAWIGLLVPLLVLAIRTNPVTTGVAGVVVVLLSGVLAAGIPIAVPAIVSTAFTVVAVLIALQRVALDAERTEVLRQRIEIETQRATLLQTVSHEFRTPLTLILGAAELIDAAADGRSIDMRSLSGILNRAAGRLAELVSVVTAAVEASDETVRPDQMVCDVCRVLNEIRVTLPDDRRRRVEVDVGPGAERLVTIPSYVNVMLRSLLDNALKFSPADEPVRVLVERQPGEVVIHVQDRGPGVPAEMADRVFDPLRQVDMTTRREAGGLGMGLFAAQRLAQRLGGTIFLDAPEAGGLDAVVKLPQRREADRGGRARPDPSASGSRTTLPGARPTASTSDVPTA